MQVVRNKGLFAPVDATAVTLGGVCFDPSRLF